MNHSTALWVDLIRIVASYVTRRDLELWIEEDYFATIAQAELVDSYCYGCAALLPDLTHATLVGCRHAWYCDTICAGFCTRCATPIAPPCAQCPPHGPTDSDAMIVQNHVSPSDACRRCGLFFCAAHLERRCLFPCTCRPECRALVCKWCNVCGR